MDGPLLNLMNFNIKYQSLKLSGKTTPYCYIIFRIENKQVWAEKIRNKPNFFGQKIPESWCYRHFRSCVYLVVVVVLWKCCTLAKLSTKKIYLQNFLPMNSGRESFLFRDLSLLLLQQQVQHSSQIS